MSNTQKHHPPVPTSGRAVQNCKLGQAVALTHNFPLVSPRGFGGSAMADKHSAIHAGRVRVRHFARLGRMPACRPKARCAPFDSGASCLLAAAWKDTRTDRKGSPRASAGYAFPKGNRGHAVSEIHTGWMTQTGRRCHAHLASSRYSSPARQHHFTPEPAVISLPPDVPEYMAPAWFGMLIWAIDEPEIVERFEQESGIPRPSTSGINQMIDESCGLPEKYVTEFAAWAHKNLWGQMEHPSRSGR